MEGHYSAPLLLPFSLQLQFLLLVETNLFKTLRVQAYSAVPRLVIDKHLHAHSSGIELRSALIELE